jgi:CRP-like cAMP-binding protein
MMEIGPRHGGYALRYWLDDPAPDDGTDSVVRAHVLAALERHGIKLGVPYQEQGEIYDDTRHREMARTAELARRLAALEHVELFASLSDSERETLASHLVHAPFVAGDVITRQGAVAHWLYLVISGEAEVWREDAGTRHHVALLRAGNVFGEMGMMTGEPRRATVTARTDVECYRLDKAGFEGIVRARPDIAHAISGVLASRDAQLVEVLATEAASGRAAPREAMLARVRRFFALD